MTNAICGGGRDGDKIAKQICDIFGLNHVYDIKIHMSVNDVFTLTVEMNMDCDGAKKLPAILQKFQLVPIGDAEELQSVSQETTSFGQEFKSFEILKHNETEVDRGKK